MGESGQWVRDPACQLEWIRSAMLVFQLRILGMDGQVSSLAATDSVIWSFKREDAITAWLEICQTFVCAHGMHHSASLHCPETLIWVYNIHKVQWAKRKKSALPTPFSFFWLIITSLTLKWGQFIMLNVFYDCCLKKKKKNIYIYKGDLLFFPLTFSLLYVSVHVKSLEN